MASGRSSCCSSSPCCSSRRPSRPPAQDAGPDRAAAKGARSRSGARPWRDQRASGPRRPTSSRASAQLQAELTRIRGQYKASKRRSRRRPRRVSCGRPASSLTEEMRRLLADYRPPAKDTTVGGIPVDSEYIIFVIDTSGSMFQGPWQLVLRRSARRWPSTPSSGIQVMNDEGKYMFSSYAGKWMPDYPRHPQEHHQPAGELESLQRLESRGGHRRGHQYLLRTRAQDQHLRLRRRFPAGPGGGRGPLCRPHQHAGQGVASAWCVSTRVGFPTQFAGGQDRNGTRFANLMRALCERNGGTFVALTPCKQLAISHELMARDSAMSETGTTDRSKRCKPCEGGVPRWHRPPWPNCASALHPDWTLSADGKWLVRALRFPGYARTMGFVNAVGLDRGVRGPPPRPRGGLGQVHREVVDSRGGWPHRK